MEPKRELNWNTLSQVSAEAPPKWLGDELATRVRLDLEPGYWSLLVKALGIHLVGGTASLLLCPQFGFHPLGARFDPLAFLQSYGEGVCAFGCGVAFSLLTSLALVIFMTRDERRVSSRLGFWLFTPLMALSWALLMKMGSAPSALHADHGALAGPSGFFSGVWVLSAIAFAWGTLALSNRQVSHTTH